MNMQNNPLVSVIVPIYNVEDYVRYSVSSIMDQSYPNIEVIVVDDCGADRSMSIVEQICEGRENVRIIHHSKNKGLSEARNTGLQEARGEWVFFLDSDDQLTTDCISRLVSLAQQNEEADIIVGQYDEFEEIGKYHPARFKHQGNVFDNDVIGAFMAEKMPATATDKLVRREFLLKNKLVFCPGLVHEDALWSFQTFCLAKKAIVSDVITYHYLRRPGSLDNQKNPKLHLEHYNRVYCLMSAFSFEKGIEKDLRLFDFIEKNRYHLLTDACLLNQSFAFDLYKETRRYPYWRQLHRYLPSQIGFCLYIRVRCWYLRLFKGF